MRKLFFAIIILTLGAAAVAKTSRSNKSSVARNITIFNAVLKELQTNYVDTIDADALVQTAIDAMLNRIDPYTEYYPYENREDLTAISTGQYGGIGAYIQRRPAGTIVSEPVYGSPAQQAGIRHGDVIIEVDGVDVTRFKESDKVSRLLRGQAGTDVKVKVRRPYVEDSILTFDITRRTINMNPMPYYGVDSAGVGYIRLTTFNEKSAELVKDALIDMKRNPDLRGVVLDLRGNGGGILEGAVQIVGLFVPKGTEVVRHSGFEGKNLKIYKTAHQPVDTEI